MRMDHKYSTQKVYSICLVSAQLSCTLASVIAHTIMEMTIKSDAGEKIEDHK